ncbi:type IV pilus modification PilV family protein [Marinicella litoralis]|uniref:Pilin/secretion family protein with methylation motif n=1 Tax=Marinicella litoralis TaxID=644220 RepID=A0A4V3DI57_9GAMM|nr:prepilin-type N-terminal cleavage/methylation domain-containing protein [Marinicella litoralis]TDR20801.1 pilin/secretion family protein with methylation motif [Marinicella litoralis]
MQRRNPQSLRQSSGFTLIEVIASFTILAMTFMVVLEILSNSSANTIKSSERTQISLMAQSKMDEVGIIIPVEEGTVSGDFDDKHSWYISIEPFEVPYEGNVEMSFAPVELFKVSLNIVWFDNRGEHRSAVFTTLKAMTPDFEAGGLG